MQTQQNQTHGKEPSQQTCRFNKLKYLVIAPIAPVWASNLYGLAKVWTHVWGGKCKSK